MSVYECEVNLSSIFQTFDKGNYPYRLDKIFHISQSHNLNFDRREKSFEYKLVCDEGAEFIRLFGCCVNIKNGDIALGLSPDPDSYIKFDNLFDIIRKDAGLKGYNMSELKRFINDEDCRYIIECLKLNPFGYSGEIYKTLNSSILDASKLVYENKSICVNLIKSKENNSRFSTARSASSLMPPEYDFVYNIIKRCVAIYQSGINIAKVLLGNFIVEDEHNSVWSLAEKSFADVRNSKGSNLETLCDLYIGEGLHPEYVIGLKSYAMGINHTKPALKFLQNYGNDFELLMSKVRNPKSKSLLESIEAAFNISEQLSAFSSMSRELEKYTRCVNVIDIIRCKGWEQSLIFAVDIMLDYKNRTMYDSIVKKFNLDDIFLECKIPESEFIDCVKKYVDKRFLSVIDCGSCYTRPVKMEQYSNICFSNVMLMNSGKLFKDLSKKVLKGFEEDS